MTLKTIGAAELIRQLEAKEISAVEYAKETILRKEENDHLNAVSHFNSDLLIQSATQADEARAKGQNGPLCGVPVVLKDNINTTAFPTTAGTTALLNNTPKEEAGVVSALLEAGAYVGGKAGMHELAFGITSNNLVTGAVRNPHDPSKIPGGSSGGSASSVAAGIFPIALGTDTGASVRLPAALCGIVGFRPTIGRYSGEGVVPVSSTRDTVGPLARHVEDITLVDSALSGRTRIIKKKNLRDVILGVPKGVLFDNLDPAVEIAVQSALKEFERAGVKLVEISLADVLKHNEAIGFPVALYEVMQELPEYLARYAPGISFEELIAKIGSPDVAGILKSQLGSDAMPEAVYRASMDTHRPAMKALYADLFKQHGLSALVLPTTPTTACNVGDDETFFLNGEQVPTFSTLIRNTDFGSNIGVPGISIPCPITSGLPVGIEFEGLAEGDEDLLSLALSVEELLTK
ncbi:MAG: indoleacetamide hydrolase [Marinomonas sp.]